jgi:hypothetical protein
MLRKRILSCCYEDCILSVRLGEVTETEGVLLKRSSEFPFMSSWLGEGEKKTSDLAILF